MSLVEACILGVVQGLTEFIPVSSSAHLVFFEQLLGFREPMLVFDLVLHLGSLVALLVYFAKEIAGMIRDSIYAIFFLFRRKPVRQIFEIAPYARWAGGLFAAMVPTAVLGILFDDAIEALFGSLRSVGWALFGTTLLLWLTRYFQKNERGIDQTRLWDYLAIGTLQGLALVPGISRLGSTLAAGLFLGLKRETATRFAFLLAIPAILGAAGFQFWKGFQSGGLLGTFQGFSLASLGAGFLAAALTSLLAIRFLFSVVEKGKLHRFAYYTLAFASLLLTLSPRLE